MTTSYRWTILGSLSLVASLAVGALGCQQETPATSAGESAESTAQPVAEAAAAKPTTDATLADKAGRGGRDHGPGARHHGPPGGPDGLLLAALHELTLTDAQKTTLQGALDGLRPARGERPAFDAAPFKALAAGVRAGKVDVTAVPTRGPDEAKFAEHRVKLAAALTTLHDTLTAEQRQSLVDLVQKKADEHGGKPGRGGKHGRGGPGGFGVMGMLHDLDLTDAQKDSIHQAMEAQRSTGTDAERAAHQAGFDAMRTGMKARLATFVAPSFDATAFVAPPVGLEARQAPKNHLATELATIVPLLTDAQRARLADRLEQPPALRPADGSTEL